jgi:hypothetical protein
MSAGPQYKKHRDHLAELLAAIRDGLTDDQLARRLAALPPAVRRQLGDDEAAVRELLMSSTREQTPRWYRQAPRMREPAPPGAHDRVERSFEDGGPDARLP